MSVADSSVASMGIETISKLGPLVGAASAFIAALGAMFAYRQYARAHEWRRGDLAAALMRELDSTEELEFACLCLDWGVGPLMVPQRYRPLLREMGSNDGATVQHSPDVLAKALEPRLNRETLESAQGLIYRHCFVKLFVHLDDIARLLASQQISATDLDGLDYWLKALSRYPYAAGDGRQVFQPALAAFGYPRIPELGRKLGVTDWAIHDALLAE